MVVVKAHFVLATQSVITRLTRVIACSMGSHNIYKGSVRFGVILLCAQFLLKICSATFKVFNIKSNYKKQKIYIYIKRFSCSGNPFECLHADKCLCSSNNSQPSMFLLALLFSYSIISCSENDRTVIRN